MDKTFQISLEAARVNAKIATQEEAGKLIGVHRDTVSRWESGKTRPGIKYMPIIERVYGISYDRIDFSL